MGLPETKYARSGDYHIAFAGSGIEFDDRGEHALKGVPGECRLYAVKS